MHFSPQNSSIFDNDYPFKIVLYPSTMLIKIFGNQIFINKDFLYDILNHGRISPETYALTIEFRSNQILKN